MTTTRRLTGAKIKTGALQDAIFNSANFSSIATDEKGVIQIFNVGAERMLGYIAVDVVNQITPADISDPQELIARAAELSLELDTPITPGFEALVFKASRGIEDIYELTYIRKDGSRFPAIVSVTALRDAQDVIIGYLLIGTDNTVAQAGRSGAGAARSTTARPAVLHAVADRVEHRRADDDRPAGIITDVNQQMIALTGRTRDELIGAPCKNFFTEPIEAEDAIKRVLTEHKVTDYELTVRAHNGVETVVSYNAATFHDRDRKLQGVFAAARDVTERKRFERTPAGEEHRARARQPDEVRVPGHDVARTAHAAERHHRLLRGAQGRLDGRDERQPAGVHRRHLHQRAAPALADQRHPRPVEGRGRDDGARAGGGRPRRACCRTACRS